MQFPTQKIPKKRVQIEPKLEVELGTREGQECRSAHGKCQLVLPKCRLAQLQGPAWKSFDSAGTHLFRIFGDNDAIQFISNIIQLIFQASNLYK